jgi:hypothetical protein
MPTPLTPAEDRLLRAGAALTGLILLVSAGLAIDLALGHMAGLGALCGADNAPHCVWCFSAASLALAGLAATAYAARPAPRRIAARRSPR